MLIKWHQLVLLCPECKTEPSITGIHSSSDGEIMLEMYCSKCEKEMGYVTTGAKLALKALIADMASEPIQQLRPPLKKPKQIASQSDHDFYRDMGIKED